MPNHILYTNPADYRFSSAIFYEQKVDDPIAIRFGLLTHFGEVFYTRGRCPHRTLLAIQ